MENKIKQYVEYQFRFDKREDIEDLKSEITANLIDRYHEKVKSGKSEDDAYIEAIKSMGDFSNTINSIPEEYSLKPTIPDILLLSGAILSIFGLLLTIIELITGAIFTTTSILLFSGSSFYLYSYSQYVRKEEMDIEKHNMLLRKIFKYMKTSFLFWTLSLSLIMSSLVMNLLSKMVALFYPERVISDVRGYVTFYIILFIIFLVIFVFIFYTIYNRLMNRYYYLTGTTSLKGKIRESYEFLYGEQPKNYLLLHRKFIPILSTAIISIHFIIPTSLTVFSSYNSSLEMNNLFIFALLTLLFSKLYIVVFPILILILNVVLLIKSFRNTLKIQWTLIASLYLWFISIVSIYILGSMSRLRTEMSSEAGMYSLIMGIFVTIILIVRAILQIKVKKQDRKE